ncbi:unnamed protein product [Blepharisma stoltei]|uniref:Uncharacterized protein n=1 Tax=Blepharisma stoltei TaxID=1481888 RepID=A0AAU9IRH8_9CILI|nr:unnamed protein product [Blepharisma stoltei]
MLQAAISKDHNKSQQAFAKELNARISKLKVETEQNGFTFPANLLTVAKEFSDSLAQSPALHFETENSSSSLSSHRKSEEGIPPHSDLEKTTKKTMETFEFNCSSLNSSLSDFEDDSDLGTTKLKKKSKSIIKGVKNQLKQFGRAQSKYLETHIRSETESSAYKEDLIVLHKSAREILNETLRTKREIRTMRKSVEAAREMAETPVKFPNLNKREFLFANRDFVDEDSADIRSLARQLRGIQTEIDSMNQRLSTKQEEFKLKEQEQTELLSTILKLRETESCVIDTEQKKESCNLCTIF